MHKNHAVRRCLRHFIFHHLCSVLCSIVVVDNIFFFCAPIFYSPYAPPALGVTVASAAVAAAIVIAARGEADKILVPTT
jgi:hypothetical protein